MSKIGFILHQGEEVDEKKMLVPCDFQHALCVGATGSGKTVSLILPTMKGRIENNHTIVAYIYKGNEDKKIKHMAHEADRLNDIIEIGKPQGSFFNLLEMLDTEAVKSVLIALLGGSNSGRLDSYWTLSAARLGGTMVEITRKMAKIHELFTQYSNEKITFNQVKVSLPTDNDGTEEVSYVYPTQSPTFKSLLSLTNNAKLFRCFFDGLPIYLNQVERLLSKDKELCVSDETGELYVPEPKLNANFVKQVSKELLKLETIVESYGKFSVSLDSGEAGGNNGVLQVLSNALTGVASKDYINQGDIDILNAIENNVIMIVDIEGLGKDVHATFLESLLSKLATRVRNEIPSFVSIFIDEANRVLSAGMDIHNDVLREANVELILAIQNEEQMLTKFSNVGWTALRKNFKHVYDVNLDHKVSYNNEAPVSVEPLLFTQEEMLKAEYSYNNQNKLRKMLYDNFDIDGTLPKNFKIVYNIVLFETTSTIDIVGEDNTLMTIEYLGMELKTKITTRMRKYGYHLTQTKKTVSL